jgi:hypothetical protein
MDTDTDMDMDMDKDMDMDTDMDTDMESEYFLLARFPYCAVVAKAPYGLSVRHHGQAPTVL